MTNHRTRKEGHKYIMVPENLLKQRIKDGEVVVALRVPVEIERQQLEVALSKDTFHLLYIDGQHTGFSDAQLVSFCAIAEDLGLPVQFRIPHTRHTYLIGRYLDMGLSALLVPEVTSEATVEEALAYSYYPQVGSRSWGGDARYGLRQWDGPVSRLAYAEWWNTYVVLAIQFESVEAISNARRLAKRGVDYVAFGPNDLQFSLEGHPNYPLQTVDECMINVAEQLQGTGIRLGMAVTTTPDERGKYLDMGITIFQEAPQL
jgi:2-keto-3-deoxy-L-rhamnonate aldolase RhmA